MSRLSCNLLGVITRILSICALKKDLQISKTVSISAEAIIGETYWDNVNERRSTRPIPENSPKLQELMIELTKTKCHFSVYDLTEHYRFVLTTAPAWLDSIGTLTTYKGDKGRIVAMTSENAKVQTSKYEEEGWPVTILQEARR